MREQDLAIDAPSPHSHRAIPLNLTLKATTKIVEKSVR